MRKSKIIFNLEKIICDRTATADIRAEIRSRLQGIYLSEENLAKLESFGFGRGEILMAHTPNNFVSMSSAEVLRSFGFCPHFNGEIAFKCMTKDYIVDNYAELVSLGATIDFDYIFRGVSRELAEYYAEKIVMCDDVDCNRLVSRLHYRAVFFLANTLLLYGADPTRVLKRLSSDEIKTHLDTFKRYGLKESEIQERIAYCSRTKEDGVITYKGKTGRGYMTLPVRNVRCANCKNNHVYYGSNYKHFCCDRCRQLFILKREARQEIKAEMEAKQNAASN